MSEAENQLTSDRLTNPSDMPAYVHESFEMGMKIDVTNIGKVLGVLDEQSPRPDS